MTTQLLISILLFMCSLIAGLIAYWLKVTHKEFKTAVKHLTYQLHTLDRTMESIKTQISKGIESRIKALEQESSDLHSKTNNNRAELEQIKGKLA